jgi:hypothetical protein
MESSHCLQTTSPCLFGDIFEFMVLNPDSNKFDNINCLQATSDTAFDCELLLDVNCNLCTP